MEGKEQLINPITGKPVDEIIKEKEGRERGYFDFEFLLKYLEDDNEYVKYFVIDGKKVVVDLEKPYLQIKKKTQINHERVHADEPIIYAQQLAEPVMCNIDDPTCESCSG